MSKTLTPGWWNPQPFNTRSKFHYIPADGRSLCGKWLYFAGVIEQGEDDHAENCMACRKKKLTLDAKAAK